MFAAHFAIFWNIARNAVHSLFHFSSSIAYYLYNDPEMTEMPRATSRRVARWLADIYVFRSYFLTYLLLLTVPLPEGNRWPPTAASRPIQYGVRQSCLLSCRLLHRDIDNHTSRKRRMRRRNASPLGILSKMIIPRVVVGKPIVAQK